MIDFWNLAANSLWILGLALALATFGYVQWQAGLTQQKLSVALNQPPAQTWLNLAGVLFCAGLAATSDRTLERAAWIGLGLVFLVYLAAAIRGWRKKTNLQDIEKSS